MLRNVTDKILDYYRNNGKLPNSINDLIKNGFIQIDEVSRDNNFFKFTKHTDNTFSLCSTFKTHI